MNEQLQTIVFLLHAIKQFTFGFETLNATADDTEDGSAAKAFYMVAVYNYIAAFFLLDLKGAAVGGAVPKTLQFLGCIDLIHPIQEVLETQIGGTSFGEIVRVFRNKVVVHTSYQDSDLDRIYALVDMQDPIESDLVNGNCWGLRTIGT